MKYFNHLSCAGEDSKVQKVRDEFGLSGYGAYFLVLEKIASQVRKESGEPSLTLALRKWAQHLDMSRTWTLNVLRWCDEVGLWSLRIDGDDVTVTVPNLLKYADEYSKKVGIKPRHSPDRSPEVVRFPGSKEVRKIKILSPTPDAGGVESAPISTEEQERIAAQLREAASKIGNAEQPKVPEPEKASGKGNGSKPPDAEQQVKYEALVEQGVEPTAADKVIEAWVRYRAGELDVYGLAASLDAVNIHGQDRTKVYQTLGAM